MARTFSFEIAHHRRMAQSEQLARDAASAGSADDGNVIQDLAAARRRLHPGVPALWIPPTFPIARGER